MQPKTLRVLDQYRKQSPWADKIGKTYHFPKKYFKLLTQPNTWFLYHEPKRKGKGEYFGCGQIGNVKPDPADPTQFFAEICNFQLFKSPVPDSTEQGKPRELGRFYNAQNAVRKVEPELFDSICAEGAIATNSLEASPNTPLDDTKTNSPYPLTQFEVDTGVAQGTIQKWIRALERKGQAIFYGPPGTGKTFLAQKLAQHLIGGGNGLQELVQFHPAYAYEDFMQGLRPKRISGGLDYPMEQGRFLDFCGRARERMGVSVLIIDELNRANLARVFGELMYLLEYRHSDNHGIPLAGGGRFNIPPNVRLIGTMNTADRSIALVDHALRRRFAFLQLAPDYEVLKQFHMRETTGFPIGNLIKQLTILNATINDPHYSLGISFFMRKNLTNELPDIWVMEIEPYLEEYFFDQREKFQMFRWAKVSKHLHL